MTTAAPLKRADFKGLDFAITRVGEMITLGALTCRFTEYTSYVWYTRHPVPDRNRAEFIPHPRRPGRSVLLSFDRAIEYDLGGVPVRLTMTSYYTCGPCGMYAEVGGSIGDTAVWARGILTGTVRMRDTVEPIVIGKYIYYITFSIDMFSLAVLEVKAGS